jgi:hypothetical protein
MRSLWLRLDKGPVCRMWPGAKAIGNDKVVLLYLEGSWLSYRATPLMSFSLEDVPVSLLPSNIQCSDSTVFTCLTQL